MKARSRLVLVCMLGVILTQAGCEDEFTGPGAYVASVHVPEGGRAGAAVLEIEGRGIQSFGGLGDTRTYAPEANEPGGVHRLVLVGTGDRLAFEIRVDDMSRNPPRGVVISAADTENQTLGVSGFSVAVRRGR